MMQIRKLTRKKWEGGSFLATEVVVRNTVSPLPWVPYESYMEAQIVSGVEGRVGILNVKFPPETSEDNRLHVHPVSDRIVTVLEGSGIFICLWKRQIQCFPIKPGSRVFMPRGVLHTFKSGSEGMLVRSIHNPFIPFDNPNCLRYPQKNIEVCNARSMD